MAFDGRRRVAKMRTTTVYARKGSRQSGKKTATLLERCVGVVDAAGISERHGPVWARAIDAGSEPAVVTVDAGLPDGCAHDVSILTVLRGDHAWWCG